MVDLKRASTVFQWMHPFQNQQPREVNKCGPAAPKTADGFPVTLAAQANCQTAGLDSLAGHQLQAGDGRNYSAKSVGGAKTWPLVSLP